MAHETIDFNRLYTACNRNGWFTCGTNEQYTKMFDAARRGATVSDLAVMIWLCSDGFDVEAIQDELEALQEEWLMEQAERHQWQKEVEAEQAFVDSMEA